MIHALQMHNSKEHRGEAYMCEPHSNVLWSYTLIVILSFFGGKTMRVTFAQASTKT
jgi:hypothetical protein